MITLNCTQCGSSHPVKPYLAARFDNHFCKAACYFAWQRGKRRPTSRKVEIPCAACGATVLKCPSAVYERTFCNRACLGAWRSGAQAGELNPAWKGGHLEYRGPNWTHQRRAARRRDNNTCQGCGVIGEALPVHHTRPFRLFSGYREANRLENLRTLCKRCHDQAEARFWREHPGEEQNLPADRQPRHARLYRTRYCAKCGEEFGAYGNAKLCPECNTFTCGHCGVLFRRRRNRARPARFCSLTCHGARLRKPPAPPPADA